jgi:hypothetical protein
MLAGVIRRVLVAVTGSVVNDDEKCGPSIRDGGAVARPEIAKPRSTIS